MDFHSANTARFTIEASVILLFILIWLGIALFLRLKKRKGYVYLLFFTIFYAYVFKVLDYTLFEFQSLLLLKQFIPNLMLNGQSAGESLNLLPLVTLTSEEAQTSLLNILMMVPFGFGLPFVTNLRIKKTIIAGALFSVAIEFLQLLTGHVAGITFRVADINDVIFNTFGTAIGYLLFIGFIRLYRRILPSSKNPILRYNVERPQIN